MAVAAARRDEDSKRHMFSKNDVLLRVLILKARLELRLELLWLIWHTLDLTIQLRKALQLFIFVRGSSVAHPGRLFCIFGISTATGLSWLPSGYLVDCNSSGGHRGPLPGGGPAGSPRVSSEGSTPRTPPDSLRQSRSAGKKRSARSPLFLSGGA